MAIHNDLGKQGEKIAAVYLRKKGYEIMATSFRYDKAEIDIICKKGNTIVFVEVKTRTSEDFGDPEEAVVAKKQEKLVKAAERFIETNDLIGESRFDVVSVTLLGKKEKVHHIRDAFYPYQE